MTAAVPPTVSILLPTLQEHDHIRECLDSLTAQNDDRVIELLVLDGGSTDGTREIVDNYGGVVRLIDNPRVTAAGAMNRGIEVASGEIIVRADAHTIYAADYVRRCVDLLLESGADNVGGPMRAVGKTDFGRAVAAVTSSPFGVGPGRFHYSRRQRRGRHGLLGLLAHRDASGPRRLGRREPPVGGRRPGAEPADPPAGWAGPARS
ncbi:MAG: glycosyltransferase [Microthrixaceae bacterium]